MHDFYELISRSSSFTLNALSRLNNELKNSLEDSSSTINIKNLQLVQLQKVILAVGMFSIFDSKLQAALSCKNGFRKARELLIDKGEIQLEYQFEIFILAINVLKHGKGRSFNNLVIRNNLPFGIITPNTSFYTEGDVSEVNTLIKVDDKFVMDCAELIGQISNTILN